MLQVIPALNVGGVESVTLDTARAVAAAGGRSLVASGGGRLEVALASAGAELIRLPINARNPLRLLRNIGRLESVIRHEKVDLVHVRSRAPAFSAIAAARRAGVPVVTTYHGIYGANSRFKRWYNGVMTRGDRTIANSTFTRNHIVAEHGVSAETIVVVPEGVDTSRFNPAAMSHGRTAALRAAWGLLGDDRRIVLLPARLTAWKGHAVAIAALARLGRHDILLVLTGGNFDARYRSQLERQIRALGLDDLIRFVGDTGDMPAAFALADLVLAPSTKPESFGRSVVEAGAMQRVVIASTLGGPSETVVDGETGWLVDPGDVGGWATAVDHALNVRPESLVAMGLAARARVQRLYSLQAMTAATFAVYRQLLASEP